jgi:DinB superfamily
MKKIQKPEAIEYASFYGTYIDKIENDTNVLDTLKSNILIIKDILKNKTEPELLYKYAPDKWSVKDILMHLIDCERVFIYRAMRFARKDKTPLPFFDENIYAIEAKADKISKQKLLKEYITTRQASIAFFNNLSASQMKHTGIASNASMSVRACAWIILSHENHHLSVLNKKYFTQN